MYRIISENQILLYIHFVIQKKTKKKWCSIGIFFSIDNPPYMSCSPLFFTKNEFKISRVYQPIQTSLVSLSVSYWFFRQNNLIGSKFVKIQNSIIVFHFSWNHVVNDSTDNKYDFHKKRRRNFHEYSVIHISTVYTPQ